MMPDDWKDQIGGHDAILFGAVGWPATVPDHVRCGAAAEVPARVRPVHQPAAGAPDAGHPLAAGRPQRPAPAPGAIDMWIVRENTEGEYSNVGGRLFEGTDREMVMQTTVMSRTGVDRC